MNNNHRTAWDRDSRLENFAAELTKVVCSVVLRRGVVDKWLDLELELCEALKETINNWDQEWPQAGVMLVQLDSDVSGKSKIRGSYA